MGEISSIEYLESTENWKIRGHLTKFMIDHFSIPSDFKMTIPGCSDLTPLFTNILDAVFYFNGVVLTKRQRQCCMMRFKEVKTAEDIAAELRIEVNTVYQHLRLALNRMINRMRKDAKLGGNDGIDND